jgi:hypothetical protein
MKEAGSTGVAVVVAAVVAGATATMMAAVAAVVIGTDGTEMTAGHSPNSDARRVLCEKVAATETVRIARSVAMVPAEQVVAGVLDATAVAAGAAGMGDLVAFAELQVGWTDDQRVERSYTLPVVAATASTDVVVPAAVAAAAGTIAADANVTAVQAELAAIAPPPHEAMQRHQSLAAAEP